MGAAKFGDQQADGAQHAQGVALGIAPNDEAMPGSVANGTDDAEPEVLPATSLVVGLAERTGSCMWSVTPVGAENPVTSCDLHILVYETAEPVSSQRPDDRGGGPGSAAGGRLLSERPVRPVRVVVLDELP